MKCSKCGAEMIGTSHGKEYNCPNCQSAIQNIQRNKHMKDSEKIAILEELIADLQKRVFALEKFSVTKVSAESVLLTRSGIIPAVSKPKTLMNEAKVPVEDHDSLETIREGKTSL